ncbi:MAG: hypothetical protein HY538_08335 [Deltaproteobacteria bacterium]|nr:hypothetical protein [Deltaproteobacteria bacterium]
MRFINYFLITLILWVLNLSSQVFAGEAWPKEADRSLRGYHLTFDGGGGIDEPALGFRLGLHYAYNNWILGGFVEENPYVAFETFDVSAGSVNMAGDVAYRLLVTDDFFLRFGVSIGLSRLNFDTVGIDSGTWGWFFGAEALGIDYRIRENMQLRVDLLQYAIPFFNVSRFPFIYDQLRWTVGIAYYF